MLCINLGIISLNDLEVNIIKYFSPKSENSYCLDKKKGIVKCKNAIIK